MTANEHQVEGSHYKGEKVQHWDFVLMHKMPYMEAQIFKYVLRWKDKNGISDLRKAAHFIEKLIEYELGAQKQVVDVSSGTIHAEVEADKLAECREALGNVDAMNRYLNPDQGAAKVQSDMEIDTGVPQPHGYVDQD
jgi:hypothetical protein